MAAPESITINGTSYAFADLDEAARTQVANVQLVDGEIIRLQQQLAIAQTARNVYIAALASAVNKPVEPPSQ